MKIINFMDHEFASLVRRKVKSAERHYRIVSVDSQISHARKRQATGKGAASAVEDSSLIIKGVWWINRESANISRIKAPSTICDAIQKRMGGTSDGKIEAKLTALRTSILLEEYETVV